MGDAAGRATAVAITIMSRPNGEQSSVTADRHAGLRQIQQRLVAFIEAQRSLSKSTLSLADSIVDFYNPEEVCLCVSAAGCFLLIFFPELAASFMAPLAIRGGVAT